MAIDWKAILTPEAYAAREAEQARLRELVPQYEAKYGITLRPYEVAQIQNAEQEQMECSQCDGQTCCKKTGLKEDTPEIVTTGGQLDIRHYMCKVGYRKMLIGERRQMGVPHRYAGKTLEDYRVTTVNKKAVETAKNFIKRMEADWCSKEKPQHSSTPTDSQWSDPAAQSKNSCSAGVYLAGSPGTGKTLLASVIVNELINNHKRKCLFRDMPTLLSTLKASFGKGTMTEELIEGYKVTSLLILDDVGVGVQSDWNVGILYDIVNSRYNNERPLIVTSNYPLKKLGAVLGHGDELTGRRIVSRLSEMCDTAYLGDTDYRMGGNI